MAKPFVPETTVNNIESMPIPNAGAAVMTPAQLAAVSSTAKQFMNTRFTDKHDDLSQITPANLNTKFVAEQMSRPISAAPVNNLNATTPTDLNTRFVQEQKNRPLYTQGTTNLNTRFTDQHKSVSKKGLWG
jgi:hypothetical protein